MAVGQDSNFDPFKLAPSHFSEISDGLEFKAKDGNAYKVSNSSTSKGLYVKKYVDGKEKWLKHGVFYAYGSSGILYSKTTHKFGKMDGEYKTYTSKGVVDTECTYKDGKKHGKWYNYYDDGSLCEGDNLLMALDMEELLLITMELEVQQDR